MAFVFFVSFEPMRGMQPSWPLLFEPGSETSRETWYRVTPVSFDPPRNKECGLNYLSGLLLINNELCTRGVPCGACLLRRQPTAAAVRRTLRARFAAVEANVKP